MFRSRSHDAVIRVYDEAGNVIDTHDTRAILKSGRMLRRVYERFELLEIFMLDRSLASG
jgi:hypothetical protein